MANKNKNLKKIKMHAGFSIIAISAIVLCITIIGSGIKFLSIENSNIFGGNSSINANEMNAEIQNINFTELFEKNYFSALEILSNTIAYGTTWLELCENKEANLKDEVYVKVCDNDFNSIEKIKKEVNKYVSLDLISIYMGDYYKEYNKELYVFPVYIEKDDNYVGFEEYKLTNETNNKIEYLVTSKYSDINCETNCKYTYKEQKFVLEKQNNNWVVTEIELPY